MKILGFDIARSVEVMEVDPSKATAEKMARKSTILPKTVTEGHREFRADLLTFVEALNAAEQIDRWDREYLHRIYRKVWRDPNLKAQWGTRKVKTLTRDFFVKVGGDVNDELTKLLRKPWFYEFCGQALDSHMWGFSLIEMPYWDSEKKTFAPFMHKGRMYDAVIEFPRDHVKPELGIVVNSPSDTEGNSFVNGRYSDQLIFIGKSHDFGILVDVASMVLIKERTLANWGEFAEVFGQDLLVAYSDSTGEARRQLELSMKNLGSSGRMITDPNTDKIDNVGNARRDAQDIFKDLVDLIDSQIAKRLFGQDVISNNTGQVVGEVGENVSKLYGDMDARWLEYVINEVLFRHMEKRGIKDFAGATFEWDNTEKLSMLEKIEKDIGVTKMGIWLDEDYMKRVYGVEGERVAPYFNRVQTEEGETEPSDPSKKGNNDGRKGGPKDPAPKA